MSRLIVAEGVYGELCTWPEWRQVFGSAGRAAVAASSHVEKMVLVTYATDQLLEQFKPEAELSDIEIVCEAAEQIITFE